MEEGARQMGATEVTHWRHKDGLEMEDGEWPAEGWRRNAQPEGQGGGLELGWPDSQAGQQQ